MDPQSIHFSDWNRILFGNAPANFLIEVLIRALITYAVLLVIIRLLGKRMSGQLSITEMAVMLTLGAIISVPMQMPERGILHGVFMLLFVVAFQRGLTFFIFKSKRIEALTQGHTIMLVKDGVLQLEQLDRINVTREQLFAILRAEGIYQLGQIKRVYQESNGNFSIYPREPIAPGYSILPKMDAQLSKEMQHATADELQVCRHCGLVVKSKKHEACSSCGHKDWESAVQ